MPQLRGNEPILGLNKTTIKRSQHGQRLRKGRRAEGFPINQRHHTCYKAFIYNSILDGILRVTHVYLECHMVRKERLHICDFKLDNFRATRI
jgi:hypothetical protein